MEVFVTGALAHGIDDVADDIGGMTVFVTDSNFVVMSNPRQVLSTNCNEDSCS